MEAQEACPRLNICALLWPSFRSHTTVRRSKFHSTDFENFSNFLLSPRYVRSVVHMVDQLVAWGCALETMTKLRCCKFHDIVTGV
jgi:hypothetical protein